MPFGIEIPVQQVPTNIGGAPSGGGGGTAIGAAEAGMRNLGAALVGEYRRSKIAGDESLASGFVLGMSQRRAEQLMKIKDRPPAEQVGLMAEYDNQEIANWQGYAKQNHLDPAVASTYSAHIATTAAHQHLAFTEKKMDEMDANGISSFKFLGKHVVDEATYIHNDKGYTPDAKTVSAYTLYADAGHKTKLPQAVIDEELDATGKAMWLKLLGQVYEKEGAAEGKSFEQSDSIQRLNASAEELESVHSTIARNIRGNEAISDAVDKTWNANQVRVLIDMRGKADPKQIAAAWNDYVTGATERGIQPSKEAHRLALGIQESIGEEGIRELTYQLSRNAITPDELHKNPSVSGGDVVEIEERADLIATRAIDKEVHRLSALGVVVKGDESKIEGLMAIYLQRNPKASTKEAGAAVLRAETPKTLAGMDTEIHTRAESIKATFGFEPTAENVRAAIARATKEDASEIAAAWMEFDLLRKRRMLLAVSQPLVKGEDEVITEARQEVKDRERQERLDLMRAEKTQEQMPMVPWTERRYDEFMRRVHGAGTGR